MWGLLGTIETQQENDIHKPLICILHERDTRFSGVKYFVRSFEDCKMKTSLEIENYIENIGHIIDEVSDKIGKITIF